MVCSERRFCFFLVISTLVWTIESTPLPGERRHPSPFKKHQKTIISEQEIRWPLAQLPIAEEPINRADCYEELDENFINYTMALPNDGQLAYRPCMIRIPTQHRITFLHMNFTDKRSNVKIVSGDAIDHSPLLITKLYGNSAENQLGPYYVPCQFAYIIFDSYTRYVRETVYFKIEEPEPNMDVKSVEDSIFRACIRPTRNHVARHFFRPVTPKPALTDDSKIDDRYSPGRFIGTE